jgi:hypothetical protein
MTTSPLRISPVRAAAAFCALLALGTLIYLLFNSELDPALVLKIAGVTFSFVGLSSTLFLRARPTMYVGFWLSLMIFLYHGFPEITLFAEQATTPYRIAGKVSLEASAWGAFVAGIFNFVFSVNYVFWANNYSLDKAFRPAGQYSQLWIDKISGRLLTIWISASYLFQGGLKNLLGDSSISYALSAALFYPLLAILTLVFIKIIRNIQILKLGRNLGVFIIFVLIVGYVFVLNERISLVVSLLSAFYLVEAFQITRVKFRQITLALTVLIAVFASLVIIRNSVGRDAITSGSPVKRIELVFGTLLGDRSNSAAARQSKKSAGQQVQQDFTYRLDANGYLGKLITSEAPDAPKPDAQPLIIAARLAVPSSLWPDKLQLSTAQRSVETYIANRYWFKNPDFDYLPTFVSVIYGVFGTSYGILSLLVIAVVSGILFVVIEFKAVSINKYAWALLLLTILNCVVFIERDITFWVIAFRNLLILLAIFWFASLSKNRTRKS